MNDKIERIDVTTPFDFLSEKDPTTLNVEEVEKEQVVQENEPETTAKEEEVVSEEVTNPEVQEEEEYEVKIKGNLAKYNAEILKQSGSLPEDFEVNDDITEEELNKAYIAYKEEPLKNQVRVEVLQELADKEGLTPEMIEEVKNRHYGVQDETLQKLHILKVLSSFKFDEKSPDFEQDASDFFRTYYQMKGIPENKISRLVSGDMDSDDVSKLIEEAQKDMSNDYVTLDQDIKSKVKEKEEKLKETRETHLKKVNTLLEGGVINSVKYTPEQLSKVKRALFDKTEVVTGSDGKKYKVTEYYKRLMEARTDLEKDLHNKILFILGGNPEIIREEEKTKTTKKLMSKLNNFLEVQVKPKSSSSTPTTNKGLQTTPIN